MINKELLTIYFKKVEEFQKGDNKDKSKLKPELQALQDCICEMWGL